MRHIGLVPCICALLAACAYRDVHERPDVELHPTLATGSATPAAAWPETSWWWNFRSPELDRLIAAAATRNPDLAGAVARVAQAKALARIAGAPLLPAVGVNADVTRQSYNESNGGVSGTFGDVTLTASYELDLWGGRHAALAAAQASLAASRYEREALALAVTADVADDYFQLLSARERLSVARENLTNAHAVLNQVEARARAGVALARDVAEQRALVAAQEAALPALEEMETGALTALALLLDRPPQGLFIAGEQLEGMAFPEVGPGLPSELLVRRPDVAAVEARLAATNANVAVARAAMLPHIDLTASGGTQTTLAGVTGGTSHLYTLAAGLTQPLFDHGALAGQRDYALAQREEWLSRYHTAVVAALGDVEKALRAIDHFSRQQSAQEQVVIQSRRAFELDSLQYRAGSEDLLNVLSTQRTLYVAEDQLAQVRLARLRALVGLYKALGGGWQQAGSP